MTSRTLAIFCVALAITGTAAPAPAGTLFDRENEAAGRALGVAEVAEATLSPAVSPVSAVRSWSRRPAERAGETATAESGPVR
jgi:hypothetical protein